MKTHEKGHSTSVVFSYMTVTSCLQNGRLKVVTQDIRFNPPPWVGVLRCHAWESMESVSSRGWGEIWMYDQNGEVLGLED